MAHDPYEALQETPAKGNLESNFQHADLYRVLTMCATCNIQDEVIHRAISKKAGKKPHILKLYCYVQSWYFNKDIEFQECSENFWDIFYCSYLHFVLAFYQLTCIYIPMHISVYMCICVCIIYG